MCILCTLHKQIFLGYYKKIVYLVGRLIKVIRISREIVGPTKWGYARVSSKEQTCNSSLQSQKDELIRREVSETNIYTEVGSATDSINKRPIFSRLVNEILKPGAYSLHFSHLINIYLLLIFSPY
jgi:predicted site-specific integrase-resolvase